ncbi:MAG: hypothetical protein LBJ25_07035 [Candidatus Margulisbacteria bacterium]|jgi:hypothetical protein|nr:hypothetical protein [Candidatus Margulisiibacteriota bacterium]
MADDILTYRLNNNSPFQQFDQYFGLGADGKITKAEFNNPFFNRREFVKEAVRQGRLTTLLNTIHNYFTGGENTNSESAKYDKNLADTLFQLIESEQNNNIGQTISNALVNNHMLVYNLFNAGLKPDQALSDLPDRSTNLVHMLNNSDETISRNAYNLLKTMFETKISLTETILSYKLNRPNSRQQQQYIDGLEKFLIMYCDENAKHLYGYRDSTFVRYNKLSPRQSDETIIYKFAEIKDTIFRKLHIENKTVYFQQNNVISSRSLIPVLINTPRSTSYAKMLTRFDEKTGTEAIYSYSYGGQYEPYGMLTIQRLDLDSSIPSAILRRHLNGRLDRALNTIQQTMNVSASEAEQILINFVCNTVKQDVITIDEYYNSQTSHGAIIPTEQHYVNGLPVQYNTQASPQQLISKYNKYYDTSVMIYANKLLVDGTNHLLSSGSTLFYGNDSSGQSGIFAAIPMKDDDIDLEMLLPKPQPLPRPAPAPLPAPAPAPVTQTLSDQGVWNIKTVNYGQRIRNNGRSIEFALNNSLRKGENTTLTFTLNTDGQLQATVISASKTTNYTEHKDLLYLTQTMINDHEHANIRFNSLLQQYQPGHRDYDRVYPKTYGSAGIPVINALKDLIS